MSTEANEEEEQPGRVSAAAAAKELGELRRQSFRRTLDKFDKHASSIVKHVSSILMLKLEWGEIQDYYDVAHNAMEERVGELAAVEESVQGRVREVEEKEKAVEAREAAMTARSEEVEAKERKLREESERIKKAKREAEAVKESVSRKLEWLKERERKFEAFLLAIDDRAKRVKAAEEEIMDRSAKIEGKRNEYEKLLSELKLREKTIEDWNQENRLRNEELGTRIREFEMNEKKLKERLEELESREKRIREKLKELGEKEDNLELFSQSVDKRAEKTRKTEEEFMERLRRIEAREQSLAESVAELKQKEAQVEEQSKEIRLTDERCRTRFQQLQLKEEEFEDQRKKIELEGNKIAERIQELELTKRKFEDQLKEFNSKEKQFVASSSSQVKVEQPHSCAVEDATDNPMGPSVSVSLKTDGKALQMFLNEHWKDHDSLEYVISALRQSSDPAELVLDAVQGFYPPHLKNGNVKFEESVVRRSCILMLEQLMKISPEIRPHVAREAMKLARDWITRMKATSEHSLEVLGFLLLLAAFGLASAFDADELLGYLIIVAHHSQTPELIRVLDFANKINDSIQFLIQKGEHIEAIELIYALNLVKEFPPKPLLMGHLRYHKGEYRKVCRRKHKKSPEEQIDATSKRIAAIKAAIKFIEDRRLESEDLPRCLQEFIGVLEKRNALLLDQNNKCSDLNPTSSHFDHKFASTASPITPTPSTSLPSSNCKTHPQKQSGNKRRRVSSGGRQKTSVFSTLNTCFRGPPPQQPLGLFRTEGAPYLFTAAGPHGFAGYPSSKYLWELRL